ncbi:MAG: 5-formyltetrahydrofolate cyclo-ligase [Candidatus Omnitrophota bacterium]|nr:MAG: 5-formyltetrahydrofolate cyclo-ligase [Candidatus Omnitrophota bacterium]
MDKQQIRKQILRKLKGQSRQQRIEKSLQIKKQLFSAPEFLYAHTVMCYISTAGEVETMGIIDDMLQIGKRVVAPMVLVESKNIKLLELKEDYKNELVKGAYGIFQPKEDFTREVSAQDIDLAVVPGVAFDSSGNRLGRGGGYFDRFLLSLKKRTIPILGLLFDFQLINHVPVLSHDIAVNKLISA